MISESQALQGAILACENAERLFMSSAFLAREGLLGQSTALCVLAFEEGAKSITLTYRSQGVEDPKTIQKCFRDHRVKHVIGAAAGGFSTSQLAKIGFKLDFNSETYDADAMQERIERWHVQADDLKKQGFYVDYRDGQWLTPERITKEQWEMGVIATGVILSAAKALISTAMP